MSSQGARSDGMQTNGERAVGPRRGWYRGVKLQWPVSPPRLPLRQLQEAVEQAVRRNSKLACDGSGCKAQPL